MYFGCSKEPPHRDVFFEYPQHMFWLRNKKTICNTFLSGGLLPQEGKPNSGKHVPKIVKGTRNMNRNAERNLIGDIICNFAILFVIILDV